MTTAEEVASWAEKAREAKAQRDRWVRQMRAEGASLRTIAATSGLSVAGVQRVIDRG